MNFFFQFYSFWLILFKYPYCNGIVIVKVIMITGCFAMYSITITITCNHKNQRLQITFRLLQTCNRLHVITITDYNYNRSGYLFFCICFLLQCVLLTNDISLRIIDFAIYCQTFSALPAQSAEDKLEDSQPKVDKVSEMLSSIFWEK